MILIGSGLLGLGLLLFVKSHIQRTLSKMESLQRVHKELIEEKLAEQHLFLSIRKWEILWIVSLLGTLTLAAFTLHIWLFLAGLSLLFLPNWILRRISSRRRKKFLAQFGESIPQMVSTLRSGQTLHRAFTLIEETHPPPLNQELAFILKQVRLGKTLEGALDDLKRRYDHVDVETFVKAVAVSRKLGSNLAESMEHVGAIFRIRKNLRNRIAALTAQGKAQAAVAILMPFVLSAVMELMMPGYFTPLLENTAGKVLLVLAGLSLLIGSFLIYKICRADWLQ